MGSPSELTPWAVSGLGEDAEVGKDPECCERGRSCDGQSLLDDPGGEDGLFEGEVDELVRRASCRVLNAYAVLLSEIGELFGATDGVDGLGGDSVEEHGQPGVDVTSLAHSLECFEVRGASFLEVGRYVEQWCWKPVADDEEEDDEQSSEATVAVEEWVDRLELVVQECGLDERWQSRLFMNESLQVVEEAGSASAGGGTNVAVSIVAPGAPIQF